MDEKKIYQEIPGGRNKFHSAILTSYSFNFHHFEYQVLKTLKNKWVINVGLLIDSDMLDKTIGLASGGLRQLTQSYSVDGIKAKGAFHPKINFLVGDNEILMIMGSGNITAGGHGKNHETFTNLYADSAKSPLLPLLVEAWKYIQYLAVNVEGYSKDRIFNIIPRNCTLLNSKTVNPHAFYKIDGDTEIALIYNDATSIFSQILKLIPQKTINLITIVCPYYDEDGSLLLELLKKFPNTKLEIYLPKLFGLPPNKLADNNRITFYSWEDTKRGKIDILGSDNFERKLHSKIFNFQSLETEYCLIGSANATVAAFGTESTRGINEEFAVLYKSTKLNFLNELGISGSKKNVKQSAYSRSSTVTLENSQSDRKNKLVRILSCDLNGLTFKLHLQDALDQAQLSFIVCNDEGAEIFRQRDVVTGQKILTARITNDCVKLNPAYVIFENNQGYCISNKKVINYLDKLYNTDPSRESRTIRGLIGALEIGKINEFEILGYMIDLQEGRKSETSNHSPAGGSATKMVLPEVHAEMTYEEAMAASKNKELHAKLTQTHNSIRLWETLSQLFKEKKESNIDELNDEEEDASATSSKERKSLKKDSESRFIKNNTEGKAILNKTKKLADSFVLAMQKAHHDKALKINEVILCQFLVVSHVITAIDCFTVYDFHADGAGKKYGGYTLADWKAELKYSYTNCMQNILLAFAKMVLGHQLEVYDDNEYKLNKLNEYIKKVVYHSLIYHYLVNNNGIENPQSEITDLACLTIFWKLGLPEEDFSEYVESISKSNEDVYFNYLHVVNLKQRLKKMRAKMERNEELFYHEQYGACLVKERNSEFVRFRSILDPKQKFSLKLKNSETSNG